MNRILLIILILFCLNSCKTSKVSENFTKVPDSIFDYFKYNSNRKTIVSVHRGGGELAGLPENCIESFEYISKKMPCIIECDIEMTEDSVMVLMHDKTLDRTSTGSGLVVKNKYSVVKNLYLEDNFGNKT